MESMELTEFAVLMAAAREGYRCYRESARNKSVTNGEDLIDWDILPTEGKNAWYAAAVGIVESLVEQNLKKGGGTNGKFDVEQ